MLQFYTLLVFLLSFNTQALSVKSEEKKLPAVEENHNKDMAFDGSWGDSVQ